MDEAADHADVESTMAEMASENSAGQASESVEGAAPDEAVPSAAVGEADSSPDTDNKQPEEAAAGEMEAGSGAAGAAVGLALPEDDGQPRVLVGEHVLTLSAALESLLFVADGPVEAAQLARVFGLQPETVAQALQDLDTVYRAGERGLRIQVRADRYQLVTVPEAAALIENFFNLDSSTRLSAPALETLAVIAYREPVTRAQIEAVRGVDCSGMLRSLLQRGLIEEVGRMETPGRPVLYGVTDMFMQHFGLTGLGELPPLAPAEIEKIDAALDTV